MKIKNMLAGLTAMAGAMMGNVKSELRDYLLAVAPEKFGPRPHTIPHKRSYGRMRKTINPNCCEECGRTMRLGTDRCANRNCRRFVGQQKTPAYFNDLRWSFRMKSRPRPAAPRIARNVRTNYRMAEDGKTSLLKGPADPFLVLTRRKERSA